MELTKAKIIELPKICDARGNLSFVESLRQIDFDIKRAYWIYDVPGGKERNGHAFYEQDECIIALSGSFDVILNDGKNEMKYHMSRSYYGLYIPNMLWRSIDNFSTNSVALILSSTLYDANDYIEDFDEYKKLKNNGIQPYDITG